MLRVIGVLLFALLLLAIAAHLFYSRKAGEEETSYQQTIPAYHFAQPLRARASESGVYS